MKLADVFLRAINGFAVIVAIYLRDKSMSLEDE